MLGCELQPSNTGKTSGRISALNAERSPRSMRRTMTRRRRARLTVAHRQVPAGLRPQSQIMKGPVELFEPAVALRLRERVPDMGHGQLDALHHRGMLGEVELQSGGNRYDPRRRLGSGEGSAVACLVWPRRRS